MSTYVCDECGTEFPSQIAADYCYDDHLTEQRDRPARTYKGALSWE